MPDAPLTRAQMAAVVNRAFGAKKTAAISMAKDVSPNEWYYADMQKAVKMTTMKLDSNMRPDDSVTRQEAFTILGRALKMQDGTKADLNKFSDSSQVDDWAISAVGTMVRAGYIKGNENLLTPTANMTRAEFAVIMNKLIKQYITKAETVTEVAPGNIMVKAPGVTLKNLTVSGDLIIGEGVGDGTVTLENVTVEGNLIARAGGIESIIITGGNVSGKVIIAKIDGKIRVFAEDGAEIEVIEVNDGIDEVIIEGDLGTVEVTSAATPVIVRNGSVQTMLVKSEGPGDIRVEKGGTVNDLTVEASATGTKVNVSGRVTNFETSAQGTDLSGTGDVAKAKVNKGADDSSITTPNTVVTNDGATGLVANDEADDEGGRRNPRIAVSAVNIRGNALVGTSLSAEINPELATVNYQWQISEDGTRYTNIYGATSDEYALVAGDIGKFIKVVVSGTGAYRGTAISDATQEIEAVQLTVTAADAIKTYDGRALVKDEATATGLVSGHTLDAVTVTGRQTLVGTSANVASAAKIVDENSVDVTANYAITYVDGALTITKATGAALDITNYHAVYDGLSHKISVNNTVAGDIVEYSTDGGAIWDAINPSFTHVGVYTVDVRVTNSNYEDRTGRGTVTILQDPQKAADDAAVRAFDDLNARYATRADAQAAIKAVATNATLAETTITWQGLTATVTLNIGTVDKTFTDITEIKTVGENADYQTIQAAINAAADGDIISVATGTYTEAFNFRLDQNGNVAGAAQNLTIKADGDVTIKNPDPENIEIGFNIAKNMGTITIDGFKISDFQSAISQASGEREGTQVHALNNEIWADYTGKMRNGIQVAGNNSLVRGNTIHAEAFLEGWQSTGIMVINAQDVLVENNLINNNVKIGININSYGGSLAKNITIRNNTIASAKNGIQINSQGSGAPFIIEGLLVEENNISHSADATNYGINIQRVNLINSVIKNNTMTDGFTHALRVSVTAKVDNVMHDAKEIITITGVRIQGIGQVGEVLTANLEPEETVGAIYAWKYWQNSSWITPQEGPSETFIPKVASNHYYVVVTDQYGRVANSYVTEEGYTKVTEAE